ncbi:hypothetical protein TeGR_g4401 [Tetraparma gracilis]|uniref:monodehydroascorbate reductase (NADH) n=1 Tax=Tetraparma gracilis TaxID=2962635 RepID=A0ABQ6N173_9STRA|nr:hypothetical protein TeGR_g4401 [Tetraparma gracilis]
MNTEELHVTVVMPTPHFLPHMLTAEMSSYYERQLSQRYGVRFGRGFAPTSLWPTTSSGSFRSLDGPALQLSATLPRSFPPPPKQFETCRGIVASSVDSDEPVTVNIPARFVVNCTPPTPSSSAFPTLDVDASGCIAVDDSCRTSDPSGSVFAIGKVATSNGTTNYKAQASAVAASLTTEAGQTSAGAVPHRSSTVLDLGFNFYGSSDGDTVTIGLTEALKDEKAAGPSTWAAFYVKDGTIVGVFLESATDDMRAKAENLVRERPQVLSNKKLAKVSIDEILSDPHLLTPPPLPMGEFHAETDADQIEACFATFEQEAGCGTIKVELVGDLMRALGADWDEEEIADASRAMDDRKTGFITFQVFSDWWTN